MQTKNSLDFELEKNKNNVFVSESIKDIVDFNEEIVSQNNIFEISLDDLNRYPVLSYSKKKDKFTIYTQIDEKCLNSVILETFDKIKLYIKEIEVKLFLFENYLVTYKIIYNENNNYLLKIKVRRKNNGI
tara:strand:- start:3037 stop:3426 length:390 start_codon:yes stop_codon:yes gene_type:complete